MRKKLFDLLGHGATGIGVELNSSMVMYPENEIFKNGIIESSYWVRAAQRS